MLKKLLKSIRANILVGLFLIIPVVATIIIFRFLFNLATGWLPAETFINLRNVFGGDLILKILTLLAIVTAFYFVGLLTRNILGRRLYQLGDKILASIPFIKGIYISVRQVSESLFTQRKTLFKEVVLVQYPRKGLYSLAFVTAEAPPSVQNVISKSGKEPCVSLFISTTPNPTSGVFILVPRSEIIPLNIPVTDALTFIMSAGAVPPGGEGDTNRPTLLDKLEEWLQRGGDDTTQEKLQARPPDRDVSDISGPH